MGRTYKDNKYHKRPNNVKSKKHRGRTIDEVCGEPSGSFKNFVQAQQIEEQYDPRWNHH